MALTIFLVLCIAAFLCKWVSNYKARRNSKLKTIYTSFPLLTSKEGTGT